MALVLGLAAFAGCARCGPAPDAADAAPPPPPTLPQLLPAPEPWRFVPIRVQSGFALPEGCVARAAPARARVPAEARFVSEPRWLGGLVIADAQGSPPRLTAVAALTLDAEGPSRDPVALPWLEASALPRLARVGARWIAAVDRGAGVGAEVLLWRGGALDRLGAGDGFEAADLACSAEGACALLTTRPLRVAAPGATLWTGSPDEPAVRWKAVEILPEGEGGEARPLAIAALEGGPVAALVEKGEIVFHAADGHVLGRLPAGHGALDAIALPRLAALTLAGPVDEDGCAREGRLAVRLVREGAPPVEFGVAAAPTQVAFRRLARGALLAWRGPIGCRRPEQSVQAVLLDPEGAPRGAPVPVGDAETFAVAARGEDVDLWMGDPGAVTWLRARCAPP
jgi:hypothetical protein